MTPPSQSTDDVLPPCPFCGASLVSYPDSEAIIRASVMNGNAMERHKDPAAWDRWVAFCNSWGHP